VGDGGKESMLCAIRTYANFIEIFLMALFLMLLLLLEINNERRPFCMVWESRLLLAVFLLLFRAVL